MCKAKWGPVKDNAEKYGQTFVCMPPEDVKPIVLDNAEDVAAAGSEVLEAVERTGIAPPRASVSFTQ